MGFKAWLTQDHGGMCISDASPYDVTHNFSYLDEPDWFDTRVCGADDTVSFRVEDECGNTASQDLRFSAEDDTPVGCAACAEHTSLSEITLKWSPSILPEADGDQNGAEVASFRSVFLGSSTVVTYASVNANCAIHKSKKRCGNPNPTKAGCIWDSKFSPSCVHKDAVFTTAAIGHGDALTISTIGSNAGVIITTANGAHTFIWTQCQPWVQGRLKWTQPKLDEGDHFPSLGDVFSSEETESDGFGVFEVVGFRRADGSSDTSCSATPPCEANVCHDTNACVEGPGTLSSIRVMCVGSGFSRHATMLISLRLNPPRIRIK